jgi:hypothetical protein
MAGPRGLYEYISDDGTTYRVKLDASNASVVGGVAAAGTEPDLPKRYRPRYILAQHPTSGQQRKLVCPDPANALWTANGGSGSLVDTSVHPSVMTTYGLKGRVGEKRYA